MTDYSGIVILFHNTTKDVIIQWTGAEIDRQIKSNIAEALFSALKGASAEDREGFHKSYGDIFAIVKDSRSHNENEIPDVTNHVVVSPQVDNSNDVSEDFASESEEKEGPTGGDSPREPSKDEESSAVDVKKEPTNLPSSQNEEIWWPQMEGDFQMDRSVNPEMASLPTGSDVSEHNALATADKGFSELVNMELAEDELHRPASDGGGNIYLQTAETCRRDRLPEGRYICNYCGCAYRHSSSLSRHRLTHKVTCKQCNQLVFEDALANHNCRIDLAVTTERTSEVEMNKRSYPHMFPG